MQKGALMILIILCIISFSLVGCTEVNRVSHNIRVNADNFNITRRITVINARTDKCLFELIGNFSVQNNTNDELEIICEVGSNVYKKHFVYLNDDTLYVIEDVSGAYVDKYHYEVNFLPEMIQPITFTSND